MVHWAELLGQVAPVHTFSYGYQREGRRRPDPLPKLIADHRKALAEASNTRTGHPVLIGKSMGSRIGCHLSLEEPVAGLICFGYPLCRSGDPEKLRDRVLRE